MYKESMLLFHTNGATVEFGKGLTDEWMKEWRSVYYDFHTMKEHAEFLTDRYFEGAFHADELLEGYGNCRRLTSKMWLVEIWHSNGTLASYAIVSETF